MPVTQLTGGHLRRSEHRVHSLSLAKRIFFTCITTLLFLTGLEAVLRLLPRLTLWEQRGTQAVAAVGQSIFCMGDSVTFGYGLNRNETYPVQLTTALSAAGSSVTVFNVAEPGANARVVRGQLEPYMGSFHPGNAPIVLLEIGHNDFVRWQQLLEGHIPGNAGAFYPRTADTPSRVAGLRLVRALRWAVGTWREETPIEDFEAATVRAWDDDVDMVRAMVRQAGGRLYMLTYLVPGVPPPGFDPHLSACIRITRDTQRKINAHIRRYAAMTGTRVIDLEQLVHVPEVWSRDYFLDTIHPTAAANALIAREIQQLLTRSQDD